MGKFYYDREEDVIYVSEDRGFGWFLLLIFLAAPFLMLAIILEDYAEFAEEHSAILWMGFLTFSVLLGWLVYRRTSPKDRMLNILSLVTAMMPVWLAQFFYLVPIIQKDLGAFNTSMEWLFVTAVTVGLAFLVIQIGLVLKTAGKRMFLSGVYLIIALLILL